MLSLTVGLLCLSQSQTHYGSGNAVVLSTPVTSQTTATASKASKNTPPSSPGQVSVTSSSSAKTRATAPDSRQGMTTSGSSNSLQSVKSSYSLFSEDSANCSDEGEGQGSGFLKGLESEFSESITSYSTTGSTSGPGNGLTSSKNQSEFLLKAQTQFWNCLMSIPRIHLSLLLLAAAVPISLVALTFSVLWLSGLQFLKNVRNAVRGSKQLLLQNKSLTTTRSKLLRSGLKLAVLDFLESARYYRQLFLDDFLVGAVGRAVGVETLGSVNFELTVERVWRLCVEDIWGEFLRRRERRVEMNQ